MRAGNYASTARPTMVDKTSLIPCSKLRCITAHFRFAEFFERRLTRNEILGMSPASWTIGSSKPKEIEPYHLLELTNDSKRTLADLIETTN